MNPSLRIAITFRDDATLRQIWWGSGIGQNLKFYYDLFELMGHEPWMLCNQDDVEIAHNGKDYRSLGRETLVRQKQKFDLIIEAGTTISLQDKELLRAASGARIAGLRCGNQMFIAAEGLFVGNKLPSDLYVRGQDRLWVLPHYADQASFLSTLHACPVDVVPYIWEPDFVQRTLDELPLPDVPDIVIMEPNISVTKNALLPMAILEHLYQAHPDSFAKAYVYNSSGFANEPSFLNNFVSNLGVLQADQQKTWFCDRTPINDVFTQKAILLGFQFENGLNNLYKEALYMGVPLVHNSPFYHETGFYYDRMQVHEAVEQILKAIQAKSSHSQLQRSREFLLQFSITNHEVQQRYADLLEQTLLPPRYAQAIQPKPAVGQDYVVSDGGAQSHYLAKGYRSRKSVLHWDDTASKDEYQDEVYRFAWRVARERQYRKIIDFGCGSAYKLMKYFADFDFTGYELEPTLSFLRRTYPDRDWNSSAMVAADFDGADMVICSDVIEHLPQPDLLLSALSQSSARTVILSTPSLEIFADWGGTASTRYGPPAIPTHYREWTTLEFGRFVNQFLPVTEHHVLDVYQSTQLLFSDRDDAMTASDSGSDADVQMSLPLSA